jgi:hypothetical protein
MSRLVTLLVAALAALALTACSGSDDAAAPTTVSVSSPTTADLGPIATAVGGVTPQGSDTIEVTIRDASDAMKSFCLWLASTESQRERGLMKVTDLAGKAGMLFQFEADTQSPFWMFQTVMPLSIAFFDAAGDFVSSADMDPCIGSASEKCATYAAAGQYRDAIEVPQGTLGDLGIGPGSAIVDRGSCPA